MSTRQTLSTSDCTQACEHAFQLEPTTPQDALRQYRRIQANNATFAPDILIVSLIFPVIAAVVAYFVTREIQSYQNLIAVVIMGLGYTPAFMMWGKRSGEKEIGAPQPFGAKILAYGFIPILVVIADVLKVGIAGAIAFAGMMITILITLTIQLIVNGPPFPAITSFPQPVGEGVFTFLMIAALTFILADVPLESFKVFPAREVLEEIPLALKKNWRDIFTFIGGLAAGGLLAGTGVWGLLHEHLWEALSASGLAGLMFGVSISVNSRDFLTEKFVALGEIRCLIHLGKDVEARFLATRLALNTPSRMVTAGRLAGVLMHLASPACRARDERRFIRDQMDAAQEYAGRMEIFEDRDRGQLDRVMALSLANVRAVNQMLTGSRRPAQPTAG